MSHLGHNDFLEYWFEQGLSQGMTEDEANCCIRMSWCHLTPNVNWEEIADRLEKIM